MLTALAKPKKKKVPVAAKSKKSKRKFLSVDFGTSNVNDIIRNGKRYTGGRSMLDYKPTKR